MPQAELCRGVLRCPSQAWHGRVARGSIPPAGTLTIESWEEWLSWGRALHRLRGETSCLRCHTQRLLGMCTHVPLPLGVGPETVCFSLETAVLGAVESCRPEHVFPVEPQSRLCGWRGRVWGPSRSDAPGSTHQAASVSASAEKVLPGGLHPPPPQPPPCVQAHTATTTVCNSVSNPPQPLPSNPLAEMELELVTAARAAWTLTVGSQAAGQVRSSAPEGTQEPPGRRLSSRPVPGCLIRSRGLPASL